MGLRVLLRFQEFIEAVSRHAEAVSLGDRRSSRAQGPASATFAKLAPNAASRHKYFGKLFRSFFFFPLQRRPLQRCVSMLQTDTC